MGQPHMLSASTKEAIKVGLAVTLSVCLALWFEFEKPYWAAIAAAVVVLTENSGYAIQKGRNSLLGTVLGVGYAFFLTAMFPQDPFLFFTLITLLLAVSVFMSTDPDYGYIFAIGIIVCIIISAMGRFDSATTFYYAILRTQETLLGIIVYSLVFKLVWPVRVEDHFIPLFEEVRKKIPSGLTAEDASQRQKISGNLGGIISKLQTQLHLPLGDSYRLREHKKNWKIRLQEMEILNSWISLEDKNTLSSDAVKGHKPLLSGFDTASPGSTLLLHPEHRTLAERHHNIRPRPRSFKQHLSEDYPKVLLGVTIFVTTVLLWIYVPVPGGFIFPMIGGALAANFPKLPPVASKQAFFSTIGFGSIFLAEYALIMPTLTQLWQLALFYFLNTFLVWKLFYRPQHAIPRLLGVMLLVILTNGALNLTPVYDLTTPLLLGLNLLIVLIICKTASDLYSALPTPGKKS
jgi:uncharacterized membrane protein YccC